MCGVSPWIWLLGTKPEGPELQDAPQCVGSGQTTTTSRWWATLGGCGAGRGEHPRFNLRGFPTGPNKEVRYEDTGSIWKPCRDGPAVIFICE